LVLAADFCYFRLDWAKPVESPYVEIGTWNSFLFYFLLILVPVIGLMEKYLIKKI
jgi:hypothetical protein